MNFELDEEETTKAKEFMKKHKNCVMDTIGAQFTFKFTPTGLGLLSPVKCSCGEEVTLTDYNKL